MSRLRPAEEAYHALIRLRWPTILPTMLSIPWYAEIRYPATEGAFGIDRTMTSACAVTASPAGYIGIPPELWSIPPCAGDDLLSLAHQLLDELTGLLARRSRFRQRLQQRFHLLPK